MIKKERDRLYRLSHVKERIEYNILWKNKNPDWFKNYLKKYRKINSDKIKTVKDRFNLKHPWYKHYRSAYKRCKDPRFLKYRPIKFIMTPNDFKKLWFRDKAWLLDRPSIDRKNCYGDYVYHNCRFIELLENVGSKKVYQYSIHGKFIKEYYSISEASRQTGIDKTSIGRCARGRYPNSGGYIWKKSKLKGAL